MGATEEPRSFKPPFSSIVKDLDNLLRIVVDEDHLIYKWQDYKMFEPTGCSQIQLLDVICFVALNKSLWSLLWLESSRWYHPQEEEALWLYGFQILDVVLIYQANNFLNL